MNSIKELFETAYIFAICNLYNMFISCKLDKQTSKGLVHLDIETKIISLWYVK